MVDAQGTSSTPARTAGARQEPAPRPYGNPQPADLKDVPTVDEIHAKRPEDVPGAPVGDHEKEFAEASRDAALHPRHLAGLHRDEPGGALKPDDKNDPGINLNVVS